MGTRNLTAVFYNGEYKVAQYGQWDGHPDGQGSTVLGFLHEADIEQFKAKVASAKFLTDERVEAIGKDWMKTHSHCSRDLGAEILKVVYDSDDGIELTNNITFAADSLFCEWAYVIDLDKNTLEVFKGFNKAPLAEGERFFGMTTSERTDGEYHQIKHVHTFELASLPTTKEFIDILTPKDEDEEE